MKRLLLALLLLSPLALAHAQTVWSTSPTAFAWAADKTFLFHVTQGGKQYVKVFTCGNTIETRSDGAVLLCEGGLNENWAVYHTNSFELNDYLFTQGTTSIVPAGSVVYALRHGERVWEGLYATSGGTALSAFAAAQVRSVSVRAPLTAVPVGEAMTWAMDPVPSFEGGFLDLPAVRVGDSVYTVMMQQLPATTGELDLRVKWAVKK